MYTKQDIVTVAAPIDSRIAKVVTIKSENDEIVVKIENVSIKDVVFSDKAWGVYGRNNTCYLPKTVVTQHV